MLLDQLAQHVLQCHAGQSIEGAERFIQQQHLGFWR